MVAAFEAVRAWSRRRVSKACTPCWRGGALGPPGSCCIRCTSSCGWSRSLLQFDAQPKDCCS
eukprot:6295118-Prymnesium_polylepis.1